MLDKENKLLLKYKNVVKRYEGRIEELKKVIDGKLEASIKKTIDTALSSYDRRLSKHRFMDSENNMYVFKNYDISFYSGKVEIIMYFKTITPQGGVRRCTVYTHAKCHSAKQIVSEVKQSIKNTFWGMRAIKYKQFKYELLRRVDNEI